MEKEQLDFSVAIAGHPDDDVVIITSDAMGEKLQRDLTQALSSYDPENKIYSTVLNSGAQAPTVTLDTLSQIAQGAQNDIAKVQQANQIIAQYVNIDEAIGMVATTIAANVNTDMRLSYRDFGTQKKKSNLLLRAKALIEDFNKQINVRSFIRDAIVNSWLEGNYICAIRNRDTNWVLDRYPLGIAQLSPYTENGRPVVQINMDELRTALNKTILKNKKGKALYFENTLKEIEASFGEEILQAYKDKEQYCRLPTDHTGVVRVNNFGRLYGLSPIFRALPSALALENLRNADMTLASSKTKTIIHQKMRDKCLDKDSKVRQYEAMAYAHKNLMKAWKQQTVVVTTPPDIESIEYITPKSEEVSTDKHDAYTRKVLSSLGVQFLSGTDDISTTVAKLSFTVLLNQINAIGEQVERVLENFYCTVLKANGIDATYVPTVRIIDSEMLDADTRRDLAQMLLGTFASSRQTAFEILGIDLTDEKARREQENADKLSEVFTPYQTSYTTTNDASPGRNMSDDPVDETKQQEDHERNSG